MFTKNPWHDFAWRWHAQPVHVPHHWPVLYFGGIALTQAYSFFHIACFFILAFFPLLSSSKICSLFAHKYTCIFAGRQRRLSVPARSRISAAVLWHCRSSGVCRAADAAADEDARASESCSGWWILQRRRKGGVLFYPISLSLSSLSLFFLFLFLNMSCMCGVKKDFAPAMF